MERRKADSFAGELPFKGLMGRKGRKSDRAGDETQRLVIQEAYKDYAPPIPARRTVERLVAGTPEHYFTGLKYIVLTNASGLSHDRRRAKVRSRKKKLYMKDALALYHYKREGHPCWIELFVDRICSTWPSILLRLQLFRDAAFAGTMYHELGHHLHNTQLAGYRDSEDSADGWSLKLTRRYIKRKYWYAFPILYVFAQILRLIRRLSKHR